MDTSFQTTNRSDEWYTPKWIIDELGHFDLDPCSPINPPYKIADRTFNKAQDGLKQQWEGRVFLNPPYSRPLIEKFVDKMLDHGNGIMLLYDRMDNKMFQEKILPKCDAIHFVKGRVRFIDKDGKQAGTPGVGSVLVALGDDNADMLMDCEIPGFFIRIRKDGKRLL